MAWSSASLSAAQQARYTANKPAILPWNVLDTYNTAAQWRTTGSWASGADAASTTYPTSNLIDYNGHTYTMPTASAVTDYLIFDLASAEIDTVAFYSTQTSLTTMRFEIADDNAFTTNLQTVATVTGIPRCQAGSLGTTLYSSVQYARMLMTASGSVTHNAYQVFAGRRYHLPFASRAPHTLSLLRSKVTDTIGENGIISRYTHSSGMAEIHYEGIFNDDDLADFKTYVRDRTEDCTRPFIWWDSAQLTYLTDYDVKWKLMRFADQRFEVVRVGSKEWEISFDLIELPIYRIND